MRENHDPRCIDGRSLRTAGRRGLALAVLVLAGCAALPPGDPPARIEGKAEDLLRTGIQAYDDGRYPEARTRLRDALEEGLANTKDRVTAHKYLGFIYCSSRETVLCRDAFRRALEIDPTFNLSPAEAGHPLWGPVFKLLKGKTAS